MGGNAMTEVIEEGEIMGETETALAIREPAPPPTTLFGTDDPAAVVEAARRAAQPLAAVVREQKLFVKIGQGEHVKVEGWTLLGSMLGVFPVVTWTHKLEDGWEAQVEARTRRGDVVGCAEAMCTRGETRWAKADEYAIRSMAQTRATSKALRQPLGFVMQLAGYNPTPAEEMPREPRKRASSQKTELPGETFEDAFGGDPADPTDGKVSLSASQKKKLDVLVGQLRESGRLHTEHLFAAVGRMRDVDPEDLARAMPGAIDENGLHYSPLRDTLSKAEASNLIDRLSKLQDAA
jgi:hypothetical protein